MAETVSKFYSAQAGEGAAVNKVPKGFKGELYEYQKKVRWQQWVLLLHASRAWAAARALVCLGEM